MYASFTDENFHEKLYYQKHGEKVHELKIPLFKGDEKQKKPTKIRMRWVLEWSEKIPLKRGMPKAGG